jgi:phage/plasmid-associated DNA primase
MVSTLSIPQPAPAQRGKISYSPDPAINATIELLLSHGWAPLPVAPAQPASLYPAKDKHGKIIRDADGQPKPLFTGKNPSYLAPTGPRLVTHGDYIDQLPSPEKLAEWFADPSVGIGTNGGDWLDVDAKYFRDAAHLDEAVDLLIESAAWVEKTQSGGYRIAITLATDPGFKNFGMAGIRRVGEIFRSHSRDFVILAPTVGAKGRYISLRRGNPLPITDLAHWGISASSASSATLPLPMAPAPAPAPNVVPFAKPQGASLGPSLLELISKKNRQVAGGDVSGFSSASDALVSLARDCYGWENFASSQGVSLADSADQVIAAAATALGRGDKLDRMLAPINRQSCQPALPAHKRMARLMANSTQPKPASPAPAPASASSGPVADEDGDILIASDDTPAGLALSMLYGEGYCRIGDALYRWAGTHYQACDDNAEKSRINRLLSRCVWIGKEGTRSRPWYSGAKVADTYSAVLSGVPYIPQDAANPGGINCTNGVLTVSIGSDGLPVFELCPHDPAIPFTYAPQVEYCPSADPGACEGLLSAIDEKYRHAVLQVFAAAIDLPMIRRCRGRIVRSLILTGDGNNGKDSLRTALSLLFGKRGITGCSIDDFAAYDHGRKFNLASLVGSRVNWASENNMSVNVDQIQCLKQLITGDPLVAEEKFRQGNEFTPRCIAIFSTNTKTVNLMANLEAIASRYAIVPFNKKFVPVPRYANEVKADSRYAYDPDWVKAEVLPSLLNRLLDCFTAIFTDGIDYSVFNEAMEVNRLGAVHLFQFADDAGLVSGEPTDFISIDEIWVKLRTWYENEGYLTIGDRGDSWADDPRPGDPLIRYAVKLKQRLERLFPAITSGRITNGVNKGKRGIFGLRWADSPPPPVAPTAAPATAPAPPVAPAPAPTDGHGLWLTPGADAATAEVELALIAAESADDLELIKASYNGSLTAVMAQWKQDRRYDLLLSKVAILKGTGQGGGNG